MTESYYEFYPALYHHPGCPRYTSNAIIKAPVDERNDELQKRLQNGIEFEQDMLALLDTYHNGPRKEIETEEQLENIPQNCWLHITATPAHVNDYITKQALRTPANIITGGVIKTPYTTTRPDLLIRNNQTQQWHVGDIKHAKAVTPNKARPNQSAVTPLWDIWQGPTDETYQQLNPVTKPEHTLQLEHYRRAIQDTIEEHGQQVSNQGFIIGRNQDATWRDIDIIVDKYDNIVENYRQTRRKARQNQHAWPDKKTKCAQCKYQTYCQTQREETNNLTLLVDLSTKTADSMRLLGITDIDDLYNTDYDMLQKQAKQGNINGYKTNPEKLLQLKIRAEAHLTNTTLQLAGAPLEPIQATHELHLDIENLPLGFQTRNGDNMRDGYVYLIGITTKNNETGTEHWQPIWADGSKKSEKQLVNDTANYIQNYYKKHPNTKGYVYAAAGAERKMFRQLQDEHQTSQGQQLVDWIDNKTTIDLHVYLKNNWAIPQPDMTLKTIAKYCGFQWRDPAPGGANSILWATAMLCDEDATIRNNNKTRVEQYNQDDTRATAAITTWVKTLPT